MEQHKHIRCPKCHNLTQADFPYCNYCGAKLEGITELEETEEENTVAEPKTEETSYSPTPVSVQPENVSTETIAEISLKDKLISAYKKSPKKVIAICVAIIIAVISVIVIPIAVNKNKDNCVNGRVHSWEVQSSTATCTHKGKITYKCRWCNKEKTENDVLAQHDFPLSPTNTTATCEKAGIETYKCRNCTETKTKSVEALGHDYTHRVCERCNYSPLRYFYFGFNLNSVGGIRAYVSSLTNTGNKRIKYISFNCYLYNSVGDAVADEIYGYTAVPVQLDGPFEIGEEKQNVISGEVIGYCKRCAEIVIKDIKITYFDNSYEFVSNNYRYD